MGLLMDLLGLPSREDALQQAELKRQKELEVYKRNLAATQDEANLQVQNSRLRGLSMPLDQADLIRAVMQGAKLGNAPMSLDQVAALTQAANSNPGGVGNRNPITENPSLLSVAEPQFLLPRNSNEALKYIQDALLTPQQRDQQQAQKQLESIQKVTGNIEPSGSLFSAAYPGADVTPVKKDEKLVKTEMGVIIDRADELGLKGKERYDFITSERARLAGDKPQSGLGKLIMDRNAAVTAKRPQEEIAAFNEAIKNYREGSNIFIGTDQSGNPVFANSKGAPNVNSASGPEGGIQPKVAPTIPSEFVDKLQKIDSMKEAFSKVKELFDPSYIGPVAGRLGKLQDATGFGADSKRAEFRAWVANMFNSMIYLRSGKQINQEEANRLADEFISMNRSNQDFEGNLRKMEQEFSTLESTTKKQLGNAGYRNVNPPSTATQSDKAISLDEYLKGKGH